MAMEKNTRIVSDKTINRDLQGFLPPYLVILRNLPAFSFYLPNLILPLAIKWNRILPLQMDRIRIPPMYNCYLKKT